MKIHLELKSGTLTELRAELEAFLASGTVVAAPTVTNVTAPVAAVDPLAITKAATASSGTTLSLPTRKSKGRSTEPRSSEVINTVTAAPSAADVALGTVATEILPAPAPKDGRGRSAADIALGLEADADTTEENGDAKTSEVSHQPDVEQLLADKAQLSFDFDRVLALQGRAAALGIVQSVLPTGTKTKVKDIEALPAALIPEAIAALRAAQAD